jgi:hypothetical protein
MLGSLMVRRRQAVNAMSCAQVHFSVNSQILDQFSQCCRRANAECKVIQPGLFLVVGSGDSLSTDRVKKSLVSRTMYIKELSLWDIGAPTSAP